MKKSLPYLLGTVFILTWWSTGWFLGVRGASDSLVPSKPSVTSSLITPFPLSPLTKTDLIQALSGDFDLMAQLIQNWDIDAKGLKASGIKKVKRLPKDQLLEAMRLARNLKSATSPPLKHKVFPQSWGSASIVLTLLTDDEVIALPDGYTPLTPKPLIPIQKGELAPFLNEQQPTLIFAAPYTAPKVIKIIHELNFPLYIQRQLFNLDDLYEEIENTGLLLDKTEQATLLIYFLKSAFLAIDNRVLLIQNKKNTLYLEKGRSYQIPTEKLVSGQLVKRIGLNKLFQEQAPYHFTQPLSFEKIRALKPDKIILGTDIFYESPPGDLGGVEMVMIDGKTLNRIDPTLILGYFDLYEALIK